MVKIQKPTPKTLNKGLNVDKVIKKKAKESVKELGTVVVSGGKSLMKNKEKKSIEKVSRNEVIVNPLILKSGKSKKRVEEAKVEDLPLNEIFKEKKNKKRSAEAPPAPQKELKEKKKNKEQTLAVDKTDQKEHKKKKVGLPPPPPTPSPEPLKAKKKNKDVLKAGLPPPPSPESPTPEQPKQKNKKLNDKNEKVKLKLDLFPTPPLTPEGKPKAEKQSKQKNAKATASVSVAASSTAHAKNVKQTKDKIKGVKKQPFKPKNKKGLSGKKAYEQKKLLRQQKKEKLPVQKTFEPVGYDEEKFDIIVSEANIERIAKALKQQAEVEVSKKKSSIFSDYHYLLNVACFKIPNCPKRMVKLNLKHSLVDKDDDVVIVVADLQRGAKADYEPTIQHYEDLFRENGIEGLKIMPFNQLRQECNTYEAVRKFGNTYDYFLVDGRVAGHVVGFCGKIFQKPRTTFHSVHMSKGNIKAEIERALQRTAYKQLHKGDLISIPIGNHKHSAKQIAENAKCIIQQLKTSYPGGMENVRGMYLKIDMVGTSSLPIFLSLSKPPEATPYVVGPREQRMLKLRKDANNVLENFRLNKEGELIKLTKSEVERKKQIKEAKAKLKSAENTTDPDTESKPQDVEGEESIVPTKKARRDDDADNDVTKKNVDDEDDDDDGDDDEDDEDDEENDVDEEESGADEAYTSDDGSSECEDADQEGDDDDNEDDEDEGDDDDDDEDNDPEDDNDE